MTRRNAQPTPQAKARVVAAPAAKLAPKPKAPPKGKASSPPKAQPKAHAAAQMAAAEPAAIPPRAREMIVEGAIVDRRYQVRRVIATGGMGVVVEAEHIHTHRRHALKAHRGADVIVEAERRRLLDEASVLATTHHANVVEVHDAGECPIYGAFIVLEALEGRSVETIITTRGALPLSDALSVMQQLCAGLEHVHARGVLHRDVKPGNIIVARAASGREVVKLIDFGLAIPLPDQAHARAAERGKVLGTPEYMAKEQLIDADTLDARCDVFAASVIFYEMLTGRLPYRDVRAADASAEPPSRLREELGARFDAVLAKGLAPDRDDRYASVKALTEAIEHAANLPMHTTRLLAGLENRAEEAGPETLNVDTSELTDIAAVPPPLPEHVRARRRHPRSPLTTPVRVTWSGGVADGRSEDLSEGGMLVMLDGAPTEGAKVEVFFDVPGTSTRAAVPSRVQWVKTGHRRTAAGIEFLSISDTLRRAIADLASAEDEHRALPMDSEKVGNP
jgi:serine/threonine protein kinase